MRDGGHGSSVEEVIRGIQALWDSDFARYMTEKSQKDFPDMLLDIGEKYKQKDYKGAAALAHEGYEWAVSQSDICESTGPGFSYFPMFHKFGALENLIKAERRKK